MFERYTEEARRALFFARYEASQRGSRSIESEHLLLGLIRESRGPVTAILVHFQSSAVAVLREIEVRAPLSDTIVPPSAEIPFSQQVRLALDETREEADRLRHPHIGPEHLLLGLLSDGQSVAGSILNQQKMTLEATREYIATQPAAASSTPSEVEVHDRLQSIKRLVRQLSRVDRNSEEAAELVARIYNAIDALNLHL